MNEIGLFGKSPYPLDNIGKHCGYFPDGFHRVFCRIPTAFDKNYLLNFRVLQKYETYEKNNRFIHDYFG